MGPISHSINFLEELQKSVGLFAPETALTVTFLLAIVADLIFRRSRNVTGFIALLGFIATGALLMSNSSTSAFAFNSTYAIDPFANFFKLLILITSYLIVVISFFSAELYHGNRKLGEYYTLIIGMTFGMFILCSSTNLIMIYIGIEAMSLCSYVLSGYTKEIRRSSEASLKYVIYGAVSSGIMIYGISLIYGLTGHLGLAEINHSLNVANLDHITLLVSGMMIIAGFAYKISAVPFHFWTPDVYEGAPVTITAFLSVASKAAGFAALIRFFKVVFAAVPAQGSIPDATWNMLGSIDWRIVIAILSVLTMTLGNLVALKQTNVKRLLAYSSIAHAGYMLMGVTVMSEIGVQSVLVYLVAYMFMNLGAFYVVMQYANLIGSEELEDYTGIGYRAPVLGICMVIFLVSLLGFPSTVGFIGKLYIFSAVLSFAGKNGQNFYWLAIMGVINSAISAYFYIKIVRNMFVRGAEFDKEKFKLSPESLVVALIIVIPTLYFGLFPGAVIRWAETSLKILVGN
ncbi:MAG: NADH-quinone oxidoreductase subunit N [Candidatus Kapabacteria bacterium]|nr:NADH-quinone oxidoreductase subunit N [Candidatus Kapabacteria bacterium]